MIVGDFEVAMLDVLGQLIPVIEAVKEGFSERAFGLGEGVLFLKPGMECVKKWCCFLFAHQFYFFSREFEFFCCALDLKKSLEHGQGLVTASLIVEHGLDEIAASVSEAGNESSANSSAYGEIAGEAITLKEANEALEECERAVASSIDGVIKKIDGMLCIAEVNPLSTELYVFFFAAIEHFDGSIVSGDDLRLQQYEVHVLVEDQKNGSDMGVEVGESGTVKIDTTSSINGALSIKRDVVKVTSNGDLSKQSGSGETIFDGLRYFCDKLCRRVTSGASVDDGVEIFEVETGGHKLVAAILEDLTNRNTSYTTARARQLCIIGSWSEDGNPRELSRLRVA